MGEPTVRPRATSLFALVLLAAMAACGGEGGASSGEGSGAPRQASAGSRATASGAGSASSTSPEELAAPTRSEPASDLGMARFYWEPGVTVPGTDAVTRAHAVLASVRLRELLDAGPDDGFVLWNRDDRKGLLTFRQTYAWEGQGIVVEDAYATVQLEGGERLVSVATGFKKGVSVSKDRLVIDEAGAGPIALKEYEVLEKARGKITPRVAPGLRVHEIPGKGFVVGYSVHVDRADDELHPYVLVVDAQTAKVVHSHRSWVE